MQPPRRPSFGASLTPSRKNRAEMLTYVLVLYLIIQQEENLIKQINETKEKKVAPYTKTAHRAVLV
jgi:hypothetical protein